MIKVLASGFYTTIQDIGRKGFAEIGVPLSGAMDLYSAKLANQLLQNNENDAVLEIIFGGCKLEFQEECVISITGADFTAKIDNDLINLNSAILVEKGSVLSFEKRNYGAITYLAVSGGFKTEKILGSRSFYKGITSDFLIKKGMQLPINKHGDFQKTFSKLKINQEHFETEFIECFKGPEYHLLSKIQKQQLENIKFTISTDNNRMGYRLNETIENNFTSMFTSAVLPGTVQLTPSGKLIILMRDCQVTGGYPRILQLTEKAICLLTQKVTGYSFKFDVKD